MAWGRVDPNYSNISQEVKVRLWHRIKQSFQVRRKLRRRLPISGIKWMKLIINLNDEDENETRVLQKQAHLEMDGSG